MLFEALDRLKQHTIITSIVMMVLGLFMLVIPPEYDASFVNILGYVIVVIGMVMVWDFIAGDKHLSSCIVFTLALLLILLGVFILVSGDNILKVLSVLFGTLLMVDGIHSLVHAWVYARRAGKKWWGLLVVLSILLVLLGIIIFNNPWWPRAHSFVKVIGAVTLFAAATGIVRLILVWPLHKENK